MEKIELNDLNMLRKRWDTQEGKLALKDVMNQRFFLSALEKVVVANSENLITDLRGINLTAQDLKDFLLFDTDIRWANFSQSTLTGPFQDTDLSFSNFEKTLIEQSNFWNVKLINCVFDDSILRDSMFEEADVKGASFRNTTFENVRFCSVDLRSAKFDGANFKQCVFYAVKLDASEKKFWENYSDDECRFEKVEWS